MVFNLEPIRIPTEVDLTGLKKGLKEVGKAGKKANTQLNKGFKQSAGGANALTKSLGRLKAAIGVAVVATAFVKFTKSSLKAAGSIQRLRIQLETLLQSQSKATEALALFDAQAKRLPFSLEQIGVAGGLLSTVANENVKSLENLVDVSANIAAVTGLSLRESSSNLQRAIASSLGAADLFREKGIGKLLEKFSDLKDAGNATGKQLEKAFTQAFGLGGPLGNATSKLFETVDGQLSRLTDASFKLRRSVGDAIIDSGVFNDVIEELVGFLSDEDLIAGLNEAFTGFAILLKNDILPLLKSTLRGIIAVLDVFAKLSLSSRSTSARNTALAAKLEASALRGTGRDELRQQAIAGGNFVLADISEQKADAVTAKGAAAVAARLEELNKIAEESGSLFEKLSNQVKRIEEGETLSQAVGRTKETKALLGKLRELRKKSKIESDKDIFRLEAESFELLSNAKITSDEEAAELSVAITEKTISLQLSLLERGKAQEEDLTKAALKKLETLETNFLADIEDLRRAALSETERIELEAQDLRATRKLLKGRLDAKDLANSDIQITKDKIRRIDKLEKEAAEERFDRSLDLARTIGGTNADIGGLRSAFLENRGLMTDWMRQHVLSIGFIEDEIKLIDERLDREENSVEVTEQLNRQREDAVDLLNTTKSLEEESLQFREKSAVALADFAKLQNRLNLLQEGGFITGDQEEDALKKGKIDLLRNDGAETVKGSVAAFGLELIDVTSDSLVTGITQGFLDSIESGSFAEFGESLGRTVGSAILEAVIEAMAAAAVGKAVSFGLGLASSVVSVAGGFNSLGGATSLGPGATSISDNTATTGLAFGNVAKLGGTVSQGQILRFATGGLVPDLSNRPFSDSVPALLQPGERVLTRAENRNGGSDGMTVAVNINTQSLDPSKAADVILAQADVIENIIVGKIQNNSTIRRALRG